MDLFNFRSSFVPKFKQYLSTGHRDQYITIDYGGSIKTIVKPDIFERKATSSPRKYSPPFPAKQPMPVYYQSDGSGRDYYITCDNGGLTKRVEYGGKKDLFKLSLRKNEALTNGHFTLRMKKWIDPRYKTKSVDGLNASLRLHPSPN